MWILYALIASVFSGLTTFFAKIGLKEIDTKLATFLRTFFVLIFSVIIVIIFNSSKDISSLDLSSLIYILSSGLTTTLLWLSYFKALSLGNINKVTPIDKTSIILTLILSSIILKETISYLKIISCIFIMLGILLMTITNSSEEKSRNNWLFYAILTSIFTSLSTILGKLGTTNISVSFVTLIRTIVIFIILLFIIIAKKEYLKISKISSQNWLSLLISALSTEISWLFYYKALSLEDASTVFPLEKLSIVTAITLSCIFLKEKLSLRQIIGLIIIIISMLLLINF